MNKRNESVAWPRPVFRLSKQLSRLTPLIYSPTTPFAKGQRVGTPGLGGRLSTYRTTTWSNKWLCNQRTSANPTPIPCVSVASPGLRSKGSGRSGTLKPDRLGLICSDAGTEDLGVLTTHETSPCFSLGVDGSFRTG